MRRARYLLFTAWCVLGEWPCSLRTASPLLLSGPLALAPNPLVAYDLYVQRGNQFGDLSFDTARGVIIRNRGGLSCMTLGLPNGAELFSQRPAVGQAAELSLGQSLACRGL